MICVYRKKTGKKARWWTNRCRTFGLSQSTRDAASLSLSLSLLSRFGLLLIFFTIHAIERYWAPTRVRDRPSVPCQSFLKQATLLTWYKRTPIKRRRGDEVRTPLNHVVLTVANEWSPYTCFRASYADTYVFRVYYALCDTYACACLCMFRYGFVAREQAKKYLESLSLSS